ncbi:MAG TPA: hypothetical protein VER96_33765 [Polyangiaceae bacterium]|nr:hypothetical protein [Polyangiaceae bacterium]
MRVIAFALGLLVGCGASPSAECGWAEVATAPGSSSRVVVYSAAPYPYCGVLPLGVSACEQAPVAAMRASDGPVSLWRRAGSGIDCRIEVTSEGY